MKFSVNNSAICESLLPPFKISDISKRYSHILLCWSSFTTLSFSIPNSITRLAVLEIYSFVVLEFKCLISIILNLGSFNPNCINFRRSGGEETDVGIFVNFISESIYSRIKNSCSIWKKSSRQEYLRLNAKYSNEWKQRACKETQLEWLINLITMLHIILYGNKELVKKPNLNG